MPSKSEYSVSSTLPDFDYKRELEELKELTRPTSVEYRVEHAGTAVTGAEKQIEYLKAYITEQKAYRKEAESRYREVLEMPRETVVYVCKDTMEERHYKGHHTTKRNVVVFDVGAISVVKDTPIDRRDIERKYSFSDHASFDEKLQADPVAGPVKFAGTERKDAEQYARKMAIEVGASKIIRVGGAWKDTDPLLMLTMSEIQKVRAGAG